MLALPGAVVQLTVLLMEKARPKKVEEEEEPDTNANVPRTARAERIEYAMANGVRPVGTMGVADSTLDEPVLELKTGMLNSHVYRMPTCRRVDRGGSELACTAEHIQISDGNASPMGTHWSTAAAAVG